MKPKKYKTFDDFDNLYTEDTSIISENFEKGDGKLETFGKDLDLAVEINEKSSRKLWTAIDTDLGICIVPGFRSCDRIYYIVTNEEWSTETEAYYYGNDLADILKNKDYRV